MFQVSSKWLVSLILGVAAIGVAGTLYVTNSTGHQETVATSNNPVVLASNWDNVTESYHGNKEMTVYRSPSCGCCGIWIEHAKKHGFKITDIKTDEMATIKQKYQIAADLESCHTAVIDGYVMEGHIPADDIKRFLKQKPNAIGLSVPGMPLGTPGMEAGEMKQPFAVLAFDQTGKTQVFNEYQSY